MSSISIKSRFNPDGRVSVLTVYEGGDGGKGGRVNRLGGGEAGRGCGPIGLVGGFGPNFVTFDPGTMTRSDLHVKAPIYEAKRKIRVSKVGRGS